MLEKFTHKNTIILLLKLSAICIFLARAWQYIIWDAPYREILWNDKIMFPILNLLGVSWEHWSKYSDIGIALFIQATGFYFMLCAWSAFKVTIQRSWHTYVLSIGILHLMLLAYLNYLSKPATMGIFIEQTIQWTTPLFLIWALKKHSKALLYSMKVAIALTFTGHGLYAMGFYTVPGDFVRLLQGTTPITSYQTAINVLNVFGIIDLIISVGIFIPRIRIFFLVYATVWGILTAMARFVSFLDFSRFWLTTSEWLYQTTYRLPQGVIPLVCLLIILFEQQKNVDKSLNLVKKG